MPDRLSVNALVVSAMVLAGCGGGKVIVNPAAPPAPTAVVVPPASSPVIVAAVPPAPAPPAQVAALGPSPGADYIRVEGYYNWLGDHYEWVPPSWIKIPRAGATYIPGHWQSTGSGYQWIPGRWQ